ncbi:MAG: hypothetical protein JNN05_07285 [Candidatus Omnitrophica bacterium]|nr:hypothetical protein [Candidatus Omnitrophota bacterium]
MAGVIVAVIMTIGTIGMHAIEGMEYIDAFYFMSMIATAQGSATTPVTVGGKIFASVMAFFSVGAAITSFGFLFGPLLGKLFHIGQMNLQEELERQEKASLKQKG